MNIKKQTQKGRGNIAQWESNSSISNSYIFFVSDGMSEGAGVCLLMMMQSSSLPEADRASPCAHSSHRRRGRGREQRTQQLSSVPSSLSRFPPVRNLDKRVILLFPPPPCSIRSGKRQSRRSCCSLARSGRGAEDPQEEQR